jgi:hypothetical protein
MASVKTFIERRLKLKVNEQKSKVAKSRERSFLSLTLSRLKGGEVGVFVANEALQSCETELKALTPRNWGRSVDDCIRSVNVFLRGWLGYFAICHSSQRARLGRIDEHVRRRLRALILKHWKRKRHIINQLVQLGVPASLARVDVNSRRRSWWSLSNVRGVCRGLTNAYFERRGLFALHANWRHDHKRLWDIGPKQLALQVG